MYIPDEFRQDLGAAESAVGSWVQCGAIATIRQCLSAALAKPMAGAQAAHQQLVANVDATGDPTGNSGRDNPNGKRGWQWVMANHWTMSRGVELVGRHINRGTEEGHWRDRG